MNYIKGDNKDKQRDGSANSACTIAATIVLRCSPRCFALRCSLSDLGLLLHGRQLDDLVLERLAEEIVDDLSLLNGDGEEVDLLNLLDLAVLYETSKLGDGDPGGSKLR